jgi:hypothetical protein
MPLDIPLPTATPQDDPSQYIPLLLSATEGFLQLREVWDDADYPQAFRYMENLKQYIVDCFGRCGDVMPYLNVQNLDPLAGYLTYGGARQITVASTQINNGGIEVTPIAQFNRLSWEFLAKAGEYEITVIGAKNTGYAIVTASITGSTVTDTVDYYNASAVANFEGVFTLEIPVDGIQHLTLAADTKNPSSGGYRFLVSGIRIARTGDLP